jgi:lysozyme family protein
MKQAPVQFCGVNPMQEYSIGFTGHRHGGPQPFNERWLVVDKQRLPVIGPEKQVRQQPVFDMFKDRE